MATAGGRQETQPETGRQREYLQQGKWGNETLVEWAYRDNNDYGQDTHHVNMEKWDSGSMELIPDDCNDQEIWNKIVDVHMKKVF